MPVWLQALLAWLLRKPPAPPPAPAPEPARPPSYAGKAAWIALALTLVAGWEGLYTHAYRDPIGVVTICYGVTSADRPVRMGDTYSKEECEKFLEKDLDRYNAQARRCIPKIDEFPPHRHAAIVSFVYNVGEGNLCKSSVARYLNQGDVQRGCDALLLWNRAGGRVLPGLTNRRQAERTLCLRVD
jgi:lysozyme